MKRRQARTLASIFSRPTSGGIRWKDIEALLIDLARPCGRVGSFAGAKLLRRKRLGAELSERQGSRVGVRLFGERRVFHRPHPGPETDKGAVASIREWLRANGVEP